MTTTLIANLHIWSSKKSLSQQGEDHPGVHIYQDKNGVNPDDSNRDCKKQWVEGRGIMWQIANKRPEKLRDNLHDLEELMETFSVAAVKWKSTRHVQVLLSNGALVSLTIGFNFADVERIFIDKSLVGKLNDQIHNAIIDEVYMVFTFSEKAKIAFVYFGKRPTDKKEGERISTLEPKIAMIDIPGPTGRRIDRRLSINRRGDFICVWWPSSSEAAWPWSPLTTDMGRTNLVIYSVSSTQLDVLCHTCTDADPLNIAFSYNQPHQLYSIESSQTTRGKYTLKSCIYECNQNMLHKVACTTLPVKGTVVCQGRNHKEDKLLLACDDGTLILYDDLRQLTQTTKASFSTPNIVAWHPTDSVVLVASSRGEIQIFDMALACIAIQLSPECYAPSNYCKIGQFFLNAIKLDKISWACDFGFGSPLDVIGCYDDILIVFDRGPLCVVRIELGVMTNGRLGPIEIVSEYIQHKQELEAVNFLNGMNWNTNGKLCFACLTIIMDYLFRLPLNLDREACIEDALGSFYAPSRVISDVIMAQFCDPISRLARRFFHHLLRHKRFEKAFLLAVDIGAKDLFMDIHYLASDLGNDPLAEAAKQRAMQIHTENTNPNFILEGSDYSSDDSHDNPPSSHGHQGHNAHMSGYLCNQTQDGEQGDKRSENKRDSGFYHGASQRARLTRNGRKMGMTEYNLPVDVTDEFENDNQIDDGLESLVETQTKAIGPSKDERRISEGKIDKGNNGKKKNVKLEIVSFGLV